MKKTILILIYFLISTIYSQTPKTLKFNRTIEFKFEDKTQDYKEIKKVNFNGTILIKKENIIIDNYPKKDKKHLVITSFKKENDTNREIYFCLFKKQKFAVALSPNQEYLTLIGIREKFIYELNK